MQNAEYIFGIIRQHTMSIVQGIHVTPGPFSLYRRSTVLAVGGFAHGYQTEDLEMALRLQKAGYKIANAPRARVYTKAPRTVLGLVKQRTRWTSGFMRNVFNEYSDMIGSTRYGALGALVLPLGVLMIGSGMVLFCLSIFEFISHLIGAYQLRVGIPLSYALSFHGGLDWFYLPGSVFLLLAGITVAASVAMITMGKRLSQTPGSLSLGVISYVLLYGLIAPLWLIRASADVAFGIKRGWR
jgi:cellulose synthase/poly-beta-1,6-N-acetylglucosamine synthase-like glycosyltransferase